MISLKKLLLLSIILIAIFFRFYNLANVPPSASLDEASIGYNAYSIIKTGTDEYGSKFPIILRAYDDWRPALYVYLVIPFVKIFGPNVFSVRLPSVIMSVLTVIVTYFLTKELFKSGLTSIKKRVNTDLIAIFSMFLLAISPWHIYISRLGHEANAGLTFFVFAFLFFLRKRVYLSFLFFTLSFMSYQSEKIFIPLFLMILFILFKKELLAIKKKVIFASIISLIIITPFLKESLSPNALIRAQGTSIFNSNKELYFKEAVLYNNSLKSNNLPGRIIHNRKVVDLELIMEGYFSHFNPSWLFFNSSDQPHKVPNLGLLYPFELPLILLGFLFLIRGNFDKKIKLLILLWIIISPLPASFTTDVPHAMRTYTFLPSFQIVSSLGFISLFNILNKRLLRGLVVVISLGLVFTNLIYLYNQYFFIFPKTQSSSFQFAISKAIPFVLVNEKSYTRIIFSNQENLYQSYMFFLFYSRYDPKSYQKEGGTKSGGFAKTHKFGKYEFRPLAWEKESREGLYLGNTTDFPSNLMPKLIINNLNGIPAVEIVEKRAR